MTPTDTYLGLRAFVDELARCGLRHACTSPGSRSTPLVLSLVRDPRIRCWSHIDERSSAFFALGAAKAGGAPVALACTSGTAAANYLPAVVEAAESGVPLLVLTTDRPPELRDIGAGQTIDQVKLYGRNAAWYLEVDEAPATPERMRFLRRLACQAWARALDAAAPIHLNFALREPLVLEEPLPDVEPGGGGRADGRPWTARQPPLARTAAQALAAELAARPRALLVAGRMDVADGREVAALAARSGLPLAAEPTSNARTDAAVAHYDLFLREPSPELAPELVVRFGDLPTSKPLRRWLGTLNARQVAVGADWRDPSAEVHELLGAAPGATAAAVRDPAPAEPGWADRWRAADGAVAAVLARELGDDLSEPGTVAALWRALPADATLLVASSMPIRDLEMVAAARPDPPRVLANRGANGIDGLVSTAYGIAAAGDGPVVLLIGDVALAHDIGGLLAGRRLGLDLTIVLLNNDGGGIFHFLPVSGEREFEEHVATPHGLDFAHAAALYGARHLELRGRTPESHLRELIGAPGTTIVEVRSDRAENRALHARLAESVRSAT